MFGRTPIAVVETPRFVALSAALLTFEERDALLFHLSCNPESGAIIPGGGGVRKLRWRLAGRGKSGGARVIYYFGGESLPLFALTIYAKGQKEDLSPAELAEMRRAAAELDRVFRRRRRP
jgi:hypothetical protein